MSETKLDRYKVVVDTDGCEKCGAGKMWTVLDSIEDCRIGQSFGCEEWTQDLADHMNQAYEARMENNEQLISDNKKLREAVKAGLKLIDIMIDMHLVDPRGFVDSTTREMCAVLAELKETT